MPRANRKTRLRIRAIGALAICLTVIPAAAISLAAQKNTPKKKSPAAALSGAELYKRHCAVCHGNDGKGNGPPPASSPFTEMPPDLTTLARRHGGKFPQEYVEQVLRSGIRLPNHGPAEMPVWGTIFQAQEKPDGAEVSLRISRLTNYLKSLQAK